jgi:hypothetical protein
MIKQPNSFFYYVFGSEAFVISLRKNEGKRVHVPPDEKTCGHADVCFPI